jgi:F0F1-type ATP synthase membrane subunit b/b'
MRRSAYIFLLGILFLGTAQVLSLIGFWKVAGLPEPHGYIAQGFVFLGLLFVLQNTLFDPYVRVLDEREEQTVGKRAKAERTRVEADEKIVLYRNAITEARTRATKEREQHALRAEDEERAALRAAKERANAELEVRTDEIRRETDEARATLSGSVRPVAADIVQQVLRTAPNQRTFSFVGEIQGPQQG